MNPLTMPAGVGALAPVNQLNTVAQPQEAFVWGKGGQRMTPAEIAIAQELAAGQMAEGSSYAPIGHVTQGLARVAQGVMGGLKARDARRAGEANAAESAALLNSLTTGASGSGNRVSVAAALANPYVSDQVRDFAKMEYKRLTPDAPTPTEMQRNYEWLAGSGRTKEAEQYLQGRVDPEIMIPMPGGPYVGPRSQMSSTIEGPAASTPAGAVAPPVAAAMGSDGPSRFADINGAGQMIQSMGAQGFLGWQQKHGTPVMVNSPEEMAALPVGTKVVSPDGREGVKR